MSESLQSRLNAIEERRFSSEALPKTIAASVSSFRFKVDSKAGKPKARCWDDHLSIEGSRRKGATLKLASSIATTQETISLGTARPHHQYFPWSETCFRSAESKDKENNQSCNQPLSIITRDSAGLNLSTALNYGFAAGSAHLLRFVTEHVELIHDPPYQDWECSLTCGTTSALDILFRLLLNRGEDLLVEESTYPGAVEAAKALGVNLISVSMDDQGLSPSNLEQLLYNMSTSGHKMPSVLYTIPSGHNPTGITQSNARRKAIYQVAEQYNILIIEDDPYHLLQLDSEERSGNNFKVHEYLNRLPRSFLSIDTSGRVIRLDTTSKILAPGLRCGWLTASSQIVNKFISHTDASTGSVSGPSQLMLYSLLEENWGHIGFLQWLVHLSKQYSDSRNKLLACCTRYLPLEICRWSLPSEGMFLWVEIQLSKFKEFQATNARSIADLEEQIYATARAEGVLISKGSWFSADTSRTLHHAMYFRLTFAAAPREVFDRAIRILGATIRKILSDKVCC